MHNVNAGAARGHYGEPKLINPERAMENATNREVEILTTDYGDERGSGIGAETHKLRMEAGKQEEPLDCGMRALRAATGGCCARPLNRPIADCRLQIGQHGTTDCGLQNARNAERAKPVRNDRQAKPNRTY